MTFRINVDSDGVVYDLQSHMIDLARKFYGDVLEQPTSWYLTDAWGYTQEQVDRLFRTPSVFSAGQPYPGAIDGINALVNAGHDVRIVTHKHGVGAQPYPMYETVTFYREHGLLERVDLVFARGDKTDYPADIVIDDKPTYAWTQDGAVNVLMDRPWNQTPTGDPDNWYLLDYRAFGWREILEIVEQMGGGVLIDKGTERSPIVV